MRPVKSPSIPLVTRAHLRGAGTLARRAWRPAYVRRLVVGDAVIALVAAAVTSWLAPRPAVGGTPFPGLALLVPLVWVAAMTLARSYEQRFLWVGPEEFRRVFFA